MPYYFTRSGDPENALTRTKILEGKNTFTRGELLARIGVAPIAIGAFAALVAEADAGTAMGHTPKNAVQYQDKPKGGAECDKCRFYINGKTKTSKGGCTQVAGPISPKGWCLIYNAGSNSKNHV